MKILKRVKVILKESPGYRGLEDVKFPLVAEAYEYRLPSGLGDGKVQGYDVLLSDLEPLGAVAKTLEYEAELSEHNPWLTEGASVYFPRCHVELVVDEDNQPIILGTAPQTWDDDFPLSLLDRQYIAEDLADISRDVHESLDNPLIPVDEESGFGKGVYRVQVTWSPF